MIESYKKAKYDARKLIAAKKQAFFDEKLSKCWQTKRIMEYPEIFGMPKKTVMSNFKTYDIKTMSKAFKDFFSNLAKSFLDKLPDPSNKYNLESVFLYYSNFAIPELFHIKSTSEEKVFKIMENIEVSKSSDKEKLPGRFLKDGAKILSKPITEMYNLSISHGIFPNACKVAKLKPIFRKGKKVDPSNYRSLISKIIEKVVHDQTNEFLPTNKILYNYQSGFRTNHSTNLCLSF